MLKHNLHPFPQDIETLIIELYHLNPLLLDDLSWAPYEWAKGKRLAQSRGCLEQHLLENGFSIWQILRIRSQRPDYYSLLFLKILAFFFGLIWMFGAAFILFETYAEEGFTIEFILSFFIFIYVTISVLLSISEIAAVNHLLYCSIAIAFFLLIKTLNGAPVSFLRILFVFWGFVVTIISKASWANSND